MSEIYVIVVDSAKARILHAKSKSSPLIETLVLDHPEGRMHTRDLTSDLPGRDSNRTGLGKHRMDSATDPKHQESIEFARDIANYMHKLISDNNVNQLMLVSAPGFLGLLREEISAKVKKAVSFELDKNLTNHRPEEIRSYLPYFKPVERLAS